MCIIKIKETSLDMTLSSRLGPSSREKQLHDASVAVGVPTTNWCGVTCCPNCRHEMRVCLTPAAGKPLSTPHRPPPFNIHPRLAYSSTPYPPSPPSPLPSACSDELMRLIDTLRVRMCLTPAAAKPLPSPHTQPPFQIPPCLSYRSPPSPLPSPYSDELMILANTLRALRLSGWYYSNLDWQSARTLLKDTTIGAFIIRDSGDRNFIFSLSIQTEKGPTSVRLHYEEGYFRLDCDDALARFMPRFRCVVELVQYYSQQRTRGAATVWVDREGCQHSPVVLKTPLRKSPPSLLHSARLAIHKTLGSNPIIPKLWCAPKHRLLPLPSILIDYLGEYPYYI